MKITHIMIFLVFFAVLLFLQFSCSTVKEYHDEKVTDDISEIDKMAILLAGKHIDAGIECADCHKEAEPGSEAAMESCMSCHENYRELGTEHPDPHNAHIASSGCDDCHHAHKPSELICLGCHVFDVQVP